MYLERKIGKFIPLRERKQLNSYPQGTTTLREWENFTFRRGDRTEDYREKDIVEITIGLRPKKRLYSRLREAY